VHGHNHDIRARHYALRAVQPSPARVEAPEPDVWLPILDITGELEKLDLTAELELLDLDAGRLEFEAEVRALQADFWSTAPRRLEEAVARITPEREPTPSPVLLPAPDATPVLAPDTESRAAANTPPPDAGEPVATAAPRAPRPGRVTSTKGADGRNRAVATILVIAVLGAFAAVFPSVVGASVPQRDITVDIDGQTFARTVRASTVGEVIAMEGITLRPGDRVRPGPGTELRAGMTINVLRAFPVDVDIDGVVRTVRTALRSPTWLRRELDIPAGLIIGAAPRVLSAGTRIEFRTPHDVTLQVDGRTIPIVRSAALDVGALLAAQGVALGPNDEVTPGPTTRLANGMSVRVFRLAEGEIAERVAVPFATETRDDPNLATGQTRVIQNGEPGVQRAKFRVVTKDGAVVAKVPIGSELLVPPVAQVVVRGTQPLPPRAGGTATHYGTGPGPGTCAHLTLKFGTMVTLTNPATGATARCRVADRGPESWTGHIIDLSPDVFRRLAPLHQGIVRVNLSY
jgi:uncharacterized protein YabE (DUF348 family)